MSVLVDTCVWSSALQRRDNPDSPVKRELIRLIEEFQAKIIGPIRQELLSGIPDSKQFEVLKTRLQAFPDIPILSRDYEVAAGMHNACRRKGIQGSHIDFLMCSVAVQHGLKIFTLDLDYRQFAEIIDIKLHEP